MITEDVTEDHRRCKMYKRNKDENYKEAFQSRKNLFTGNLNLEVEEKIY